MVNIIVSYKCSRSLDLIWFYLFYSKSKSISTVSPFYMEEDRAANQRSAFPLSLNIIAKQWKWIWTKVSFKVNLQSCAYKTWGLTRKIQNKADIQTKELRLRFSKKGKLWCRFWRIASFGRISNERSDSLKPTWKSTFWSNLKCNSFVWRSASTFSNWKKYLCKIL